MLGAVAPLGILAWYQWLAVGNAVAHTRRVHYVGVVNGTSEGGYSIPGLHGTWSVLFGNRGLWIGAPIALVAIVAAIWLVVSGEGVTVVPPRNRRPHDHHALPRALAGRTCRRSPPARSATIALVMPPAAPVTTNTVSFAEREAGAAVRRRALLERDRPAQAVVAPDLDDAGVGQGLGHERLRHLRRAARRVRSPRPSPARRRARACRPCVNPATAPPSGAVAPSGVWPCRPPMRVARDEEGARARRRCRRARASPRAGSSPGGGSPRGTPRGPASASAGSTSSAGSQKTPWTGPSCEPAGEARS